jgi:hypothetical protein
VDWSRRALRIAAVVEPLTLLVLVVNLATVHADGVASALGPLHGTAYLVAIASTWAGAFPRRARLLALIPGFGALLAARVPTPTGPGPRPAADAGPGGDIPRLREVDPADPG